MLEYKQEVSTDTTPLMKFHEAANIFPMMGEEEYQRLVTSIRENGLREPIWTYQGEIIDGRNRYKACLESGIDPLYREWDGNGSLIAFVVDLNLERRHLTSSQKAMSAIRIEQQLAKEAEKRVGGRPLKPIGDDNINSINNEKPVSTLTQVSGRSADQAAKITGASGGYVRDAKKIVSQAPELEEAVLSGILNIPDAKRVAKLPEPERLDIVHRITSGSAKNVRLAKTHRIREEREKLYTQTVVDHEDYRTYHCSVSELKEKIKEASLDAIVTDPPYQHSDLPVYTELAEFAAYTLKPGGSLIAMVGKYYLPEIMEKLGKHLNYHWVACYYTPGATSKHYQRHIGIAWKPLLWFVKGEYNGPWVKDMLLNEDIPVFTGKQKDKQHHDWGQPVSDMEAIIEQFTLPGQLICDPFAGGGSTAVAAILRKRRFVGCDIDERYVQTTRKRVKDTLEMLEEDQGQQSA